PGEVKAGRFRADLFYRLDVVHIQMPPLRERSDDIPLLVDHFVERFSQQYRVAPKRVTAEALEQLCAYAWPGNIRELQNVIERAFALSSADLITFSDLAVPAPEGERADALSFDDGALPTLADTERRLVTAALRQSGGNK